MAYSLSKYYSDMAYSKKYFEKVDTQELVNYLRDHYSRFSPNRKSAPLLGYYRFDEKDEVVTPWQPGYIFSEETRLEWVELLDSMIESGKYVVFGRASDIFGEFSKYNDWPKDLSVIWKVDTTHYEGSMYCKDKCLEAHFKYGFYPSYVTLMGPLPRMMIWKVFKLND